MDLPITVTATVRIGPDVDDGPPTRPVRRVFTNAARWAGPGPDDAPDVYATLTGEERRAVKSGDDLSPDREPIGRRVLRQLAGGNDVSMRHVRHALDWCRAAMAYYVTTDPPVSAFAAEWKEHAPRDLAAAADVLAAIWGAVDAGGPRVIHPSGAVTHPAGMLDDIIR
jgi:hypothetical protein